MILLRPRSVITWGLCRTTKALRMPRYRVTHLTTSAANYTRPFRVGARFSCAAFKQFTQSLVSPIQITLGSPNRAAENGGDLPVRVPVNVVKHKSGPTAP